MLRNSIVSTTAKERMRFLFEMLEIGSIKQHRVLLKRPVNTYKKKKLCASEHFSSPVQFA